MIIDEIFFRAMGRQDDGTRTLASAIVMAADSQGKLEYAKAYGVQTLNTDTAQELNLNATFLMASMTKLMTSIAVMQTVERGLISLDDDVSNVLHEWKTPDILEGFDESGEPILRKAKNKITLRLLLCHASGIGYDTMDAKLAEWRKTRGQEPKTLCGSIDEGYTYPLLFEPGEGWAYGAGLDWAGRLVERLNGDIRLGEYMQSNIWTPLGMTSTTFDLESNQHIKSRLVDMAVRGPTGQLAHFPTALYPSPAKDDCGGIGSYSTAPDYMKILISLLRDDGRLLHTDSINEMFNPQLSDPTHLIQALNGEHKQMLAGSFPEVIKANHGLAGIINLERLQNRRMAGSMQWSGVPNLFWWIDREAGVCGTYFSQVIPMGDKPSIDLYCAFEKYVYEIHEGKEGFP